MIRTRALRRSRVLTWTLSATGIVALAAVVTVAINLWGSGDLRRSADSTATLLIIPRPPADNQQVAFGGTAFTLNDKRCVQWGSSVIVGLPGSSIASDGKSFTLMYSNGAKSYRIGEHLNGVIGGSSLGAGVPGLPSAEKVCGAHRFILIQ